MSQLKIPWRILIFSCVGGLVTTLALQFTQSNLGMAAQDNAPALPALSQPQLREAAKSITVKVLSQNVLGSGFIVKKQASVYTVLTNAHVLRAGAAPYTVQTPDGQVHRAKLANAISLAGKDLALLQFSSPKKPYPVAKFAKQLPKLEESIAAGGFPFPISKGTARGLVLRNGKVVLILNKALKGGYQIGCTNLVEKGMSGGPVINEQGQVIAIDGMHAEPLWGSPYIFIDGSLPEPALTQEMRQYSWAIPLAAFYQTGFPTSRTSYTPIKTSQPRR